jgi:hypothetical protein
MELSSGVISNPGEDVGEPSLRIDPAKFGGLDQREHRCGALAPAIGTGKQPCLTTYGNRPVILPISGRRSSSIIAGTHIMGAAFVANMSSGAPAAISFTLR